MALVAAVLTSAACLGPPFRANTGGGRVVGEPVFVLARELHDVVVVQRVERLRGPDGTPGVKLVVRSLDVEPQTIAVGCTWKASDGTGLPRSPWQHLRLPADGVVELEFVALDPAAADFEVAIDFDH